MVKGEDRTNMITVSVKYVDGVQFLDKVSIDSWESRNGIPVQLVDDKLLQYPEYKKVLGWLMLEEVDFELTSRIHIYAQRPVNDIVYKAIKFGIHFYWKSVRFLYDNMRFFKQIPEGERFSWNYFTPYVWYRSLARRR